MDRPSRPAVVLTRAPEDNLVLAQALRHRGIEVRELPCIDIRFIQPDALPARSPDAVTFSSRQGVRAVLHLGLAEHLSLLDTDRRPVLAAVGPATARTLDAAGISVDLVAEPPRGKVLAGLLIQRLPAGSRIVLVRGNLRAGALDRALQEAGYRLDPCVVYENLSPEIPSLDPFPVAAIFVASPSAARRLVTKNPWMKEQRFYAIGQTTLEALRTLEVAASYDIGASLDGWVEALVEAYRQATGPEEP